MGNAFGNGSYGMGWCLPCLDEGLSALLADLRDRGLLDSTLVVVMGEFGRTPRINQPNASPGRQHWPSCWSAILAGGGIRGGAVYGESDRIGAYVKDRPVRLQDLGATISTPSTCPPRPAWAVMASPVQSPRGSRSSTCLNEHRACRTNWSIVLKLFEHVACTVCGCVCDDLRITVEKGRITKAEGACRLAEPWYLGQDQVHPPVAQIDGQPATFEDASVRAAEILRTASSPLIYGLSRSSTEGQRAAVSLAERIGATIDTTASLCHASSIMAMQDFGEVSCTLGEVKNRADLVIFWGANPVESHPRHFERYSLLPPGRCIPRGRADRTLVVVDVKPTATTAEADLFLQVEPGRDFEALTTLRKLVRGEAVESSASTGAPLAMLNELARRMKSCRYGVVFFGLGLSMTGLGQHNVGALLLLVRDLNAYTRFSALGGCAIRAM